MNSAYMKHLGIELPPLRIRCEVDREKRQVHAVLEDNLDSALLVCFCRQVEEAENIRLIDRSINEGQAPDFSLKIEVWGQRFDADLAEIWRGPVTVALRKHVPKQVRMPGAMAGKIKIIDDDDGQCGSAGI